MRYTLSEAAQSCRIRRIDGDGTVSEETASAEARADQPVDFAQLPNGEWVFGRYDPGGGWATASPGAAAAAGAAASLSFGAPLHDDIRALRGCTIGFLVGDSVAAGSCRVERFESKAVSSRTTIERTCTAPAGLAIAGVFTAMLGEMKYYPVDGPEGEIIVDLLKRSISEGVVDFSRDGIPGMPAIPGVLP